MKKTLIKGGAIAITCCAFVGTLASFSAKKDDDKKKKYQIVHRENGVTVTYDTILPMNSTYTVDQFLAAHNIENNDVKVINVPMPELPEDGNDRRRVFMHEFSEDIQSDGNEEIRIIREDNGDGKVEMHKYVDGVEVELTEADKEQIRVHEEIAGDGDVKIKMRMLPDDLDHFEFKDGDHEEVRIMIEMDDDGNKTVKKFVNGEEVEVSADEIRKIELEGEGGMNEMIFELEHEGISEEDQEALMEKIHIQLEEIMEEHDLGNGTEMEERIIIHEIESDGNKDEIEMIIESEHSTSEWISEDGEEQIRVMSTEGDEDFTVVLVMEGCAGDLETKRSYSLDETNTSVVYPNPTNGKLNIRFDQTEKVKTTIEVRDAAGKLVFEENLGNFSGAYEKEINLKENGAGTYIVTIQQGNDQQVEKIIVR